jgi:LmbE family N-acetylglucosaminyl deacetylase
MAVTILSPHPDDAVFSCWHLLAGTEEVRVLNVFAGVPRDPGGCGWWDALTGAADAATRVAERLDEDRRALERTGRVPTNLGFVDAQYRRRQPSRAAITRAVGDQTTGTVYAPAAVSGHPDHLLVRDCALTLRRSGIEVRLYADLPHAVLFGWPGWISGESDGRYLRPERLWDWWLATAGLDVRSMHADLHPMNGMLDAKRQAIEEYHTQAQALAPMLQDDRLGYELVWSLPEVRT